MHARVHEVTVEDATTKLASAMKSPRPELFESSHRFPAAMEDTEEIEDVASICGRHIDTVASLRQKLATYCRTMEPVLEDPLSPFLSSMTTFTESVAEVLDVFDKAMRNVTRWTDAAQLDKDRQGLLTSLSKAQTSLPPPVCHSEVDTPPCGGALSYVDSMLPEGWEWLRDVGGLGMRDGQCFGLTGSDGDGFGARSNSPFNGAESADAHDDDDGAGSHGAHSSGPDCTSNTAEIFLRPISNLNVQEVSRWVQCSVCSLAGNIAVVKHHVAVVHRATVTHANDTLKKSRITHNGGGDP